MAVNLSDTPKTQLDTAVSGVISHANPFVGISSAIMSRNGLARVRSNKSQVYTHLSGRHWRAESSTVIASDEERNSRLAIILYRGSAVFLAIYGFGSAISFGVHLIMARLLGAMSYGYFVYAASWMTILLLGCNIGLKPTVVRFVAAYKARGEWGSVQGLLRCSTWWTITSSTAITSLALIALWLLRPHLNELGATLALMALAMPFMALTDVWTSAVRGLGA